METRVQDILKQKDLLILCVGTPVVDVKLPYSQDEVPEEFKLMYQAALKLFEHEGVTSGKKIELGDIVGLEEKWQNFFTQYPVTKDQFNQLSEFLRLGGGVVNIIRVFNKLGVKADMLSKAGKDRWGFLARHLLEQDDEVCGQINLVKGYPTSLGLWAKQVTSLVNRHMTDVRRGSYQEVIDYKKIVAEAPSAVMVSSALAKLPENLRAIRTRWPNSPILLLGTSTVKDWSLEQAREILSLVPYVRMNVDELIGILKSTCLLDPGFVEGISDVEALAKAASQLTCFMPEDGLLVATGGAGQTVMITQCGSYRILPCPPRQKNPITRGAGDASTALAYLMGLIAGVDFHKPGADWSKALEQECAVFCAMMEYVKVGEVNPHMIGVHVKSAADIVDKVVNGSRAKSGVARIH